jgi:hypothetical protein
VIVTGTELTHFFYAARRPATTAEGPVWASQTAGGRFGLAEEGVDLLHVVARPQVGGRELLGANLLCCQRGVPYPEEIVTDSVEEGVDLLHVIARPQASGGKPG